MRVAVDALQLRHDHRGIGRYVRQLLPAMARELPSASFVLAARDQADADALREELSPRLPDGADRLQVLSASAWSALHVEVAWYPWNFVRLRPASGAIVPTVHDLAPLRHDIDGRWWKVLKRLRAERQYRAAVSQAHHIVTGAELARDELVARLGVARDRVSVVPHAADEFAGPGDAVLADRALREAGVSGPFVLALASRERRKNLGVLWRALDLLAARDTTLPLVLAGTARLALPSRSWLHRTGFVSDGVLTALYARALAVVVPSRYEGFGLPVLEAMAAGGAVVCADASTLPEVAGEAALRFPADDAEVLAAALQRLRDEPSLGAALRRAGAVRAAAFSWQSSARGTLEAFRCGMAVATRSATRAR
jgi:alpha-1,3-rhamnosyl/mannosyltransferase